MNRPSFCPMRDSPSAEYVWRVDNEPVHAWFCLREQKCSECIQEHVDGEIK